MPSYKSHSDKSGFTLIELTVSIGVLGLALTITGGVLLSIVRSFQKQADIQRIERNGDLVLRLIEEKVRKAKNVLEVSVIIDSANRDVLRVVNEDSSVEYFGAIPEDSDDSDCTNGYVYVTSVDLVANSVAPNTGTSSSALQSGLITDKSAKGVNLATLEFTVNNSSSPQNVSMTLEVTSPYQNPSGTCSKKSNSKKFQTFISARGSY